MKSTVVLFLVLFLISFPNESKAKNLGKSQKDARVTVGVFYNPYNSDSMTFIQNQGKDKNGVFDLMLPNSNDLEINFVPWTNLNTDARLCPEEDSCYATSLHACAINLHKNDPDGNHQIFHFILCTESNPLWKTNASEAVVQCVNQIGEWPDDGEYINECAKNVTQSHDYLADMKQQADAANVTEVPWVTINGQRNENAASDLKTEVCNSFDGTKPDACTTGPVSNPLFVTIYYNPNEDNSISYISSQGSTGNGVWDLMMPNQTGVEIDFVPWSNANSIDNNGNFTCPGETDCLATRLHSCAIAFHQNDIYTNHQIFHFIVCTTAHPDWKTDPAHSVVQCINQIDEWPDEAISIEMCAKNREESDEYLTEMKNQAENATVTKVPWVTINGQRNENAETDLLTEVCNSFDDMKPDACSAQSGSSTQSSGSTGTPPINPLYVSIFYNPYDDGSISFIYKQGQGRNGIWDLMLPDRTEVEVDFIPWSNANSVTDSGNFTCPGEEDCLASRLQSCAIAYHQNNIYTNHQIFHFILCTTTHPHWKTNPTESVIQCVNQIGEWPDEGESIEICAKNKEESDEYLYEMKNQAENATVTKVPWVTINGQRNENAETDLLTEICNSFDGAKPDACSAGPVQPLSYVSIFYNPYDDGSITFIYNQGQGRNGIWDLMLPGKTELEVDFIPWSNANSVTDSGNFTCPGEEDCLASRLQSCAIAYHQNNIYTNHQIFHFILCTTTHPHWKTNPTESVIQCVNQIGEWPDEGETIELCAKNKEESDEYLYEMKNQAENATVTKVPWVTINNERNENAETDLLTEVCNSFGDNKPDGCSGGQPGSSSVAPPVQPLSYVSIFYNPYDDGSISFIYNQGQGRNGIWDLMLPGKTELEVDFIPWSNANSVTDSGNFTCPGEEDCLASRLQSCAIAYHQNDIYTNHQIFHFILCTTTHPHWKTNPTESVIQCVNQIGEWPDDGESIEMCAKNKEESNEYLYEMKNQAENATVTKVPWVTINGERNTNAETDLLSEVCNSFGDNKPDGCSASPAQPLSYVSIFYNPYNDNSISFIGNQGMTGTGIWYLMLPGKTELEVDFIPWSNANSVSDSGVFNCPGETDCLATRLQSCAIAYHQNNVFTNHQIFHFIVCTSTHPDWKTNPTHSVVQCINQVGEWPDEAEDIEICAKNKEESDEYLYEMKNQAENATVIKVPWVTINGEHNTNAETDLLAEVCNSFGDNKPVGCPGVQPSTPAPPAQPLSFVSIFYNPYNDGSISFIGNQGMTGTGIWYLMLPGKTELEVDFIPWSNANSVSDSGVFNCPGETDCLATRLQSCAIAYHQNNIYTNHQIFHFIVCTSTHPDWKTNPTHSVVQCINQVGEWPDEAEDIEICAKNKEESDEYLYEMKNQAENATVTKVPWVTINGERNTNAETDLLAEVCSSFGDNKPVGCPGVQPSSSTTSTPIVSDQPGSSTPSSGSSSPVPPTQPLSSVSIFYNPYNNASISFIGDQAINGTGIWDLMLPGKTELKVDFIPWSNANSIHGTNHFMCPDETDCLATRLQSCAVAYHQKDIYTNHQIFHFIVCTTTHPDWKTNPTHSVVQCINQVGEWPDEAEDIEICAKNKEESDEYLYEMKNQAENATVTKVPWVTINGERNTNAETDLLAEVCSSFGDNKPVGCPGVQPSSSTTSTPIVSDQPGSSTPSSGSSSPVPPTQPLSSVSIFYNPYNNASISFIGDQAINGTGIWDLMLPGKTELKVDFIPWSNANSIHGTNHFMCPDETDCLATRLQSCAVAYHQKDIYTNHQIFHFIVCTTTHPDWKTNPTHSVVQCINQVGEWPDEAEDIEICAKNKEESDEYLYEMKNQAENATVTKVPWVTINGERNTNAETDLLAEVCSSFGDNKPVGCPGVQPSSSTTSTPIVSDQPGSSTPSSGSSSPVPPTQPLSSVSIFYNPYNNASISFIGDQAINGTGIWDLMLPGKTELKVDFIPWSNANSIHGTNHFMCPDETDCLATRLQSCAVAYHQKDIYTNHQIFHFIVCTTTHPDWKTNPTHSVVQCINQVGEWPDEAEDIEICAKNKEESDVYLTEMKDKAGNATVTKVPWVTINGNRNEKAESDLLGEVCSSFGNAKVDGCPASGAAHIINSNVFMFTLITVTIVSLKELF